MFDLQKHIGYVPLMTSKGCPFDCAYCAAKMLNPGRTTRDPNHVVEEIDHWHRKWRVEHFVFYDDALLMDCERHAALIFEGVIRSNLKVKFHTPNALHIRWISPKVAVLMKRAGFETVRLGLETAKTDNRPERNPKVSMDEFRRAITNLKAAGFENRQIGVYLLAGLPNQSPTEISASIREVKKCGVRPVLAHYTPIPHTTPVTISNRIRYTPTTPSFPARRTPSRGKVSQA